MKVCHAALLVPLIVFLLVLPYEVNGRRRSRKEQLREEKKKRDEYEVSHIRKREMKLTECFTGTDNLRIACDVCDELYNIDKHNCVGARQKAKLTCFQKAKADRTNFQTKWKTFSDEEKAAGLTIHRKTMWFPHPKDRNATPERKLRLPTVDDFFKPQYLTRSCKICADIGGVNQDECLSGSGDGRKYCGMTIDEMRPKFNVEWDKGPSNRKNSEK